MIERIKKHFSKICIVLAIVAVIIQGYFISKYIGKDNLSNEQLITLIDYALMFASDILLIVLAAKNKLNNKTIAIPVMLFLSGLFIKHLNETLNHTNYANVYILIAIIMAIVLNGVYIVKKAEWIRFTLLALGICLVGLVILSKIDSEYGIMINNLYILSPALVFTLNLLINKNEGKDN